MPRQAIQDSVDVSVDSSAELTTQVDDLRVSDGTRVWVVAAGADHGLWCLDQTSALPLGPGVVATQSGTGRWIYFGASGGGGGGVPPLSRVLFVDWGTAVPVPQQDGSIGRPYSTIQAAIDVIPAGVDAATIRQVWVVLIAPGDYDEDLVIDGTHRRICLIGLGPWNLGQFNGFAWAASGVPRDITWTVTASNIDSIRHTLCIGTMMVPGEGLTTHPAYTTGPRISGRIVAVDTVPGGTTGELYVQAQVFDVGGTGLCLDATAYVGILNFYTWRGRYGSGLSGPTLRVQVAERIRFQGLITCRNYSRIDYCQIEAGITVTNVTPDIQPSGMTNTNFAGTFTGPAGSAKMDGNTNYWFKLNGALLAGGATKVIQGDLVP